MVHHSFDDQLLDEILEAVNWLADKPVSKKTLKKYIMELQAAADTIIDMQCSRKYDKIITIKLDRECADELSRIAEELGLSRSFLIRLSIAAIIRVFKKAREDSND